MTNIKVTIALFEALKHVAEDFNLPLTLQNKATQEKLTVDLVELGNMLTKSLQSGVPSELDTKLESLVGPYIIYGTNSDKAAFYRCYMYYTFLNAVSIASHYPNKASLHKDNAYISYKIEYEERLEQVKEFYNVCD